jgi:hypothetical protein
MEAYLAACEAHAATRTRVEPGFLGSFRTSTGGDVHEITQVTHHVDYDARDDALRKMRNDPAWRAFIEHTAPMLQSQSSEMYLPASACVTAAGKDPNEDPRRAWRDLVSGTSREGRGVFEIRTYQLELGYGPIPKLIEHMVKGLPSKLASDVHARGTLVGMFYSDVGRLNRFLEIWRFASFQDHVEVREAAREAKEWREAIGSIAPMVQMFDTKLVEPTTS